MSVAQEFLAEFDGEMPSTRKLLERVPSERGSWKPHPKSFSLGHLAQLVARMPGWLVPMLRDTKLDIGAGAGYSLEKTEALLAQFDGGVHEGHEALASTNDRDLDVPWSLVHGSHVLFTMPRRIVVRQHLNHIVHHRGQLTVYLRLNDVPLPSIYGPTADAAW
ncbi:MAG TPA: DinB family protein [Gemmatimonadaceae bacterium]|nr:DinB family protein [Gemmatimonadaceae bacterium]